MAFKQYTRCVDINDFNQGDPVQQAVLAGLALTMPAAVFALLMVALAGSNSSCYALLLLLWLASAVFCYCEWFLYGRLICIPAPADHPADSAGDHLAIGTLINILPVDPVGDNDFSIGILLQGMPLGITKEQIPTSSSPFAYLITQQPVTQNAGLLFTGHHDSDTDGNKPPCSVPGQQSEDLHCEFEGRGMYDLDVAANIAYIVALAAVAACLFGAPGWLIAVLAGLVLLLLGVGLLLGLSDPGSPKDVNVGELHTNDCNHIGADTLIIKGRWVYDSGHRFPNVNYVPFLGHQESGAWNEIHPITFCSKANSDGADAILLRNRWQAAIDDATSPATLASQAEPQNQWQVHPLIDGCQPQIIV